MITFVITLKQLFDSNSVNIIDKNLDFVSVIIQQY